MAEHTEWTVYDDCGHTGHGEADPGVVYVEDIGYVCEDAHRYSICRECHTDDGVCREDSPLEQAWPCDAAVAQARVKVLEEENADLRERYNMQAHSLRQLEALAENGRSETDEEVAMRVQLGLDVEGNSRG